MIALRAFGPALLGELCGTSILVFAGTGAIVIDSVSGGAVTHVGVALTFGLVVLAMIHTFGSVSGAHLNPAVTLGLVVAGRFPVQRLTPYIFSQVAGGLLASVLLRLLFPDHATLGATIPAGTSLQSFLLEVILTFILMLVVLRLSDDAASGSQAGLVVGSVIALEALFAGPVCGASMNPARSIGPAVVSWNLLHLWIYIAAPVIGALIAVPVSGVFRSRQGHGGGGLCD